MGIPPVIFPMNRPELMSYTKYFKSGQKILLTAVPTEAIAGRTDSLTTYLQDSGKGYFDLLLPYGGQEEESYPFAAEMPFVISSEAYGLGLKLSCHYASRRDKDVIRVRIADDLQVFQRRGSPRIDIETGLRYTKGRGALRTFREQWEKNIRILHGSGDLSKLGAFPRRPINLSAGGVRFEIKGPVEVADICLVLIDYGQAPPICSLAEVVWVKGTESAERFSTGMRFVSLLDSDLKRLETLIQERQKSAIAENEMDD